MIISPSASTFQSQLWTDGRRKIDVGGKNTPHFITGYITALLELCQGAPLTFQAQLWTKRDADRSNGWPPETNFGAGSPAESSKSCVPKSSPNLACQRKLDAAGLKEKQRANVASCATGDLLLPLPLANFKRSAPRHRQFPPPTTTKRH